MEFTSPRNVNANRASLRLYEDSILRNNRKLERAVQQEAQCKSSAMQFKASKVSEMILKRASFRDSTPRSTPTADSSTASRIWPHVEAVATEFDGDRENLDVNELCVKQVLHSSIVTSASTQPSPSISAVIPDVSTMPRITSPCPSEGVAGMSCESEAPPVRCYVDWALLFDRIWKDTLGKA